MTPRYAPAALRAFTTAILMVDSGWGVLPTVLVVLLVGAAFGALQGVATAVIGIQSFIVTLAGLQVARGLARIWSGLRRRAIAARGA